MIAPSAVRRFLARVFRLRDSRKVKRLSRVEVDRKLARLDPPPRFVTDPRLHQAATFLLVAKYPTYGVWFDPGGGKSKVLLDLIAWRIRRGDIEAALVLVPLGSQLPEWEDEAKLHQPRLRVATLDGEAEERAELLTGDAQVVIVTYAGFLAFANERAEFFDEKKQKARQRFVLDDKMLRLLVRRFGLFVLDESHYVQSADAITARTVLRARRLGLRYLYELTGTAMGGKPGPLWTQFYLLDFGATLGATLGLFRAVFFSSRKGYFGGTEFTFKREMTKTLHRCLWNRAIRYREDEFTDVPPVSGGLVGGRFMVKYATISEAASAYYENVREKLRAASGNPQAVENVFHRMRQLTSGYMTATGEDGGKLSIEFPVNPKLDVLVALLRSIPADRKAIVFCVYRTTGGLLRKWLAKEKLDAVLILGRMTAKRRREAIEEFKHGRTRFLVANEALATGGNYQVADYVVFYESPTPLINRRQEEKRAPRGMKKRRTYIYDIVVRGSIDEKILRALEKGADVFEEVLNGRTRL